MNEIDRDEHLRFCEALESEDIGTVETVLRHSPGLANTRVNEDLGESLPLEYAIYDENVELVKCLLRYGARVDSHDEDGDTPLHTAAVVASSDETAIASVLLDHGADVAALNDSGETPLQVAATYNGAGELTLLLERCGSPMDPLSAVALSRTGWLFEYIASRDADEADFDELLHSVLNQMESETAGMEDPEEIVVKESLDRWMPIIELLLEKGADPNAEPCLPTAVRIPDIRPTQRLLDHGLDIRATIEEYRHELRWGLADSPIRQEMRSLLNQHGMRGARLREHWETIREELSFRSVLAAGFYVAIATVAILAPAVNGIVQAIDWTAAAIAVALAIAVIFAPSFHFQHSFKGFVTLAVAYTTRQIVIGELLSTILLTGSVSLLSLGCLLHTDWAQAYRFESHAERMRYSLWFWRAFGPSSHPAALYAFGCFGLVAYHASFQPLMPPFGWLRLTIALGVTMGPIVLMGVAFWRHWRILRIIGPVVCLFWAAVSWWIEAWFGAVFLTGTAWNLVRWNWEEPPWLRGEL